MVDRYFSLFRIYSYIPREEEGDVFHLDSPGGGSRQRSIISPALSPHGSQGQLISDQFVIMTPPHPPRPSVSRPRPVTSSHRTHTQRTICKTQKIQTVICLTCHQDSTKDCSAQVLVAIFLSQQTPKSQNKGF